MDERISTSTVEEKKSTCRSLWEEAAKAGEAASQNELDRHRLVSKEREAELNEKEDKKKRRVVIERKLAVARGDLSLAWKRGKRKKDEIVNPWLRCDKKHALQLYVVPSEDVAPSLYGGTSNDTAAAASKGDASTTDDSKSEDLKEQQEQKNKEDKKKRKKKTPSKKKNKQAAERVEESLAPITCNLCKKGQKKGAQCYGCDDCKFDMCYNCAKVKKIEHVANRKREDKLNMKKDKKKAKTLKITYKEYLKVKEQEREKVEQARWQEEHEERAATEAVARAEKLREKKKEEEARLPSTRAYDFDRYNGTVKLKIPSGMKAGEQLRIIFDDDIFGSDNDCFMKCRPEDVDVDAKDETRVIQMRIPKHLDMQQTDGVLAKEDDIAKTIVPAGLKEGEWFRVVFPDQKFLVYPCPSNEELNKCGADRMIIINSSKVIKPLDDEEGEKRSRGVASSNSSSSTSSIESSSSIPAADVIDFDCEGGSGVRVQIPEGLYHGDPFRIKMKDGTYLRGTNGKHRTVICPTNEQIIAMGGDRILSVLYVEKTKELKAFDIDSDRGTFKITVPKNMMEGETFNVMFSHGKYVPIVIKQYTGGRTLLRRLPSDMDTMPMIDALYFDQKRRVVQVQVPQKLKEGEKFRVLFEINGKGSPVHFCILECPTEKRLQYCDKRTLEIDVSKKKIQLYEELMVVDVKNSGAARAFHFNEVEKLFKVNVPTQVQDGEIFEIHFEGGVYVFWTCPSDKTFEGDEKEQEKREPRTLVITLDDLEAALVTQLGAIIKKDRLSKSKPILSPPPSACTSCGKKQVLDDMPLKVCTCENARYCPGGKCQKAHWKKHKAFHKKMITPEATKARAAAAKEMQEMQLLATKQMEEEATEQATKQAREEVVHIVAAEVKAKAEAEAAAAAGSYK